MKALQIHRQAHGCAVQMAILVATAAAGAFICAPQCAQRQARAPMAHDIGLDRRYLDLVVFPDQFHLGVGRHRPAAELAMSWPVVVELIGIVRQPTIVRFMPGLRPARTRVLALGFLVGGRRLRRIARRFIRSLKLDHQLNQLVLAQALQISAIHAHMDSEIVTPWQGARGNQRHRPHPCTEKMAVGNYRPELIRGTWLYGARGQRAAQSGALFLRVTNWAQALYFGRSAQFEILGFGS